MTFSVLYGFWGGCFVSLLSPVAAHLFGHEQLANLSGLLTLFNLPGERLPRFHGNVCILILEI